MCEPDCEDETLCGKDVDSPHLVAQCQRLAGHKGECHSCCEDCACDPIPTLTDHIPTIALRLARFALRPVVRIYGWLDDEITETAVVRGDYTLYKGGEGNVRH